MARQWRGIEVFGRDATVVRSPAASRARAISQPVADSGRTRVLGGVALLVSLTAAVLFTAAVRAQLLGDDATPTATAALLVGVAAVVLGTAALVSGRGRALALGAIAIAVATNPWIVHRLLDWAGSL